MKYMTKRQRKRKKVQIFNRIGQIYYQSDTESEAGIELDLESEIEADDLQILFASNKKVPIAHKKSMSTQLPLSTKGIAKGSYKSKPQQQHHHQNDGTATTCDNRRVPFGFGTCSLPAIDRDLECYYHRNIPLTLGNFMNLEHLNERQGQRLKSANATQNTTSEQPAEHITDGQTVPTDREENLEVSVNELLTRFAFKTPYQELAHLTLAMLKNTAFGPLATGSSSTGDNQPSFEFWPHPYQLSYLNNDKSKATNKPHKPADAMPEGALKPIGYEAKCKHANDRHHQQQQLGNGDYWRPKAIDLWQHQHCNKLNTFDQVRDVDPNPNSIVDSIKCIWQRNRQWDNGYGNNHPGNIWSVVEPQQQHQQQLLPPTSEYSWDQRSRSVLNASRIYGYNMPESQQHGQQLPATAAATCNNGNHDNNNCNNNLANYNALSSNGHIQNQQQHQQQQQQHFQQQLQHAPFQNQQQHWQWQQYRPKPRPQFYPGRFYKSNACNNNVLRKCCKQCGQNARYNNTCNNHHNSNIEQLPLNMSQEDLDATQMYAIYGERFFEMPMGKKYKHNPIPFVASALPHRLAAPPPPPPPSSYSDIYNSNRHIYNWQSASKPQFPKPAEISAVPAPQALQKPVMMPACPDSNQYTANFPPLPVPNQKRADQNARD